MKRIAKLAAVFAVVGAATLPTPAPVSAAPARNTNPITVVRHDYTTAYKRIMTACMAGSTDWNRFEQCARLHPDNGERCTRIELWFDTTPETFRVVRDEC